MIALGKRGEHSFIKIIFLHSYLLVILLHQLIGFYATLG